MLYACTGCSRRTQTFLNDYSHQLVKYGIIPEAERELYSSESSQIKDAVRKRELKIKQYKKEKELRSQIEVSHPHTTIPSRPDCLADNTQTPQPVCPFRRRYPDRL